MPKIVLRLEHQLRGLDDGNPKEPTPLAFVVDILVLVVPAVVVVLSAALAVYLSV
jgi:hypothetical protein